MCKLKYIYIYIYKTFSMNWPGWVVILVRLGRHTGQAGSSYWSGWVVILVRLGRHTGLAGYILRGRERERSQAWFISNPYRVCKVVYMFVTR